MKKLILPVFTCIIFACTNPILAMQSTTDEAHDCVTEDVRVISMDASGNVREVIFASTQANLFALLHNMTDPVVDFTKIPYLCYETLEQIKRLITCVCEEELVNFVQRLSDKQVYALLFAINYLGLDKDRFDCLSQHLSHRLIQEKDFSKPHRDQACLAYVNSASGTHFAMDQDPWGTNRRTLVYHLKNSRSPEVTGFERNFSFKTFSPDGQIYVISEFDALNNQIFVYETENGKQIAGPFGGTFEALSNDGSLIVVQQWVPAGVVVYHIRSKKKLAYFPKFFYCDMSPDGKLLALMAPWKHAIKLFSISDGREICTILSIMGSDPKVYILGPWLLMANSDKQTEFFRICDGVRATPYLTGEPVWIDRTVLLIAVKNESRYVLYFLGDEIAPRKVAELKNDKSLHFFGTQTPIEQLLALAKLHGMPSTFELAPGAASSDIMPTPSDTSQATGSKVMPMK